MLKFSSFNNPIVTSVVLFLLIDLTVAQCGCPNCQPCCDQQYLCFLRAPPVGCACPGPLLFPPPVPALPPPPRKFRVFDANANWNRLATPYYMQPGLPPLPLQSAFASPPNPLLYAPPPPMPFYQPPPCFCGPQQSPCPCMVPLPPPPPAFAPLPLPSGPLFEFLPPPPVGVPAFAAPMCPCGPNVKPCMCPASSYLFRYPFARSRKFRRYRPETKSIVAKDSSSVGTKVEAKTDAKTS
ncbi:hypothetical protein M3Y98_01028600 [Aphelenchoides besseyi]|nr:hypothetical protein M3Y98_01028600 [Aphelenchoides besseyi]